MPSFPELEKAQAPKPRLPAGTTALLRLLRTNLAETTRHLTKAERKAMADRITAELKRHGHE